MTLPRPIPYGAAFNLYNGHAPMRLRNLSASIAWMWLFQERP